MRYLPNGKVLGLHDLSLLGATFSGHLSRRPETYVSHIFTFHTFRPIPIKRDPVSRVEIQPRYFIFTNFKLLVPH